MQNRQHSYGELSTTRTRLATLIVIILIMIGLVAAGGAFPRFYTGFAFTTLHACVFAAAILLPLRYALVVGLAMGISSILNSTINSPTATLTQFSRGDVLHLLLPRLVLPYLYDLALRVSRKMDPQSLVFTSVMAGFLGTLMHTAIFVLWFFFRLRAGDTPFHQQIAAFDASDLVRISVVHFPIEAVLAMFAGALVCQGRRSYVKHAEHVGTQSTSHPARTPTKTPESMTMPSQKTPSRMNPFVNAYAVVIGIGNDLPCTIDDAKGVYEQLVSPKRCAFDPKNVRLLLGSDATCAAIEETLHWLNKSCTLSDDASFFFYYSGHGAEHEGNYFLVPFDFSFRKLSKTALLDTKFSKLIDDIKSERGLIFLDCCHAGAFSTKGALKNKPVPKKLLAMLQAGKGRAVISSCREEEYSLAGKPYSVFTSALLEGLAGYCVKERNGFVQLMDLLGWIGSEVPARTNGSQNPVLNCHHVDLEYRVSFYAGGDNTPKRLDWSKRDPIPPTELSSQGTDESFDALAIINALCRLDEGEFETVVTAFEMPKAKLQGTQEVKANQLLVFARRETKVENLVMLIRDVRANAFE